MAFRSFRTSAPAFIECPPVTQDMESPICSRLVANRCGPNKLEPVWATKLPPCQITRAGAEGGFSVSCVFAYWSRASLTKAPPTVLASDPVPERVRKYARPSLERAGWKRVAEI